MIRPLLASAAFAVTLVGAVAHAIQAGDVPATQQAQPSVIPAEDIAALRANPTWRAIRSFNERYGEGAAYRHVSGVRIRDANVYAYMERN